MIRIDTLWLATEPIDMRVGFDTALGEVVKVFGAVRPHHAYLFSNKRSTRIKVLVYGGFGIWLVSRRLSKGTIAKNLILMSLATLAVNAGFEWEQELKARVLNHLYSAIIVMLLMMRYNMQ